MDESNKQAAGSHTPGPWRLGKFKRGADFEELPCKFDVCVDTDNGVYVLASTNTNFPEDAEANARRIVACVNALAHVTTEELESGKLQSMVQRAADAEKQRDELATKAADLDLALFAENQKRQDVERHRDKLLAAAIAAYELLKVIHDETGKVGSQLQAAIAAVKGGV